MNRANKIPVRIAMSIAACAFSASAIAAPPTLPTKCQSGNCGASVQGFLQYGYASATPGSDHTLIVNQTTSKAILNWANFNIAGGYAVDFLQPSATAAVLNNIWSADPSVIAGRINAKGQVYLVNQNGIVFDKGAQIDVGGLTASTLSLPSLTFENGILAGNAQGTVPAPVFVAPSSGTAGAIDVNAGATLTAADGGRIMLLGSAVANRGNISTPDGQTILGAATNGVYLAASANAQMRGLLIEVDGGGTTGTVINQGQISAARGNITLAGLIVNQEGMLSATTSVSANGSIYLVAGDTSAGGSYYIANPRDPNGNAAAFGGLAPNNGGTLVLAPGSVTQVMPDAADTGSLSQAQLPGFIPSQVDLAGRVVALEGNAVVHAPGGNVNVYASGNPYQQISVPTVSDADGGSIYLAPSSTIDVSGLSGVSASAAQNLLQVTLETDDLQNAPLLRNGFLHGTTVTVDIRTPPSLFDVTPYENNIQSNIDQILTKAGTIDLNATGAVIARVGSTLNVSGGSIAYQAAYGPSTTNLIGANGQIYNIGTAPSNIQYVGIANGYSYLDPTWGTKTSGNGRSYYAGYTQGGAAGTVVVQSPEVYLRGALTAQTVDGLYQRDPGTLAPGGTLVVGCNLCTTSSGKFPNFGLDGGVLFANNAVDSLNANVVVDGYAVSAVSLPAVNTLSPEALAQSGFSNIDVYSNGAVTLPAGINIALAAGGGLTVKSAQSIAIDGNVRAPGGSVDLTTAASGLLVPSNVSLGAGAVIDVSGNWTNDSASVTPAPGTLPIVLNGGSVALTASGDVLLGAGSRIDASGGGWINQKSQLADGSGGAIALVANYSVDPSAPATDPYTGSVNLGAGAALVAASLNPDRGGTLSLQSGSITIGSSPAGTPGELMLAPGFFTWGGFAQYNITGQNDVLIGNTEDTGNRSPVIIAPLEQTLLFTRSAMLIPSGSALSGFTSLETLPSYERSPANVAFMATASDPSGADIGDVTLARDAAIVTDPGASVLLAANGYNGNLRVFGTVDAPAGNITLQLENPNNALQSGADPGYIARQVIELGPQAVLNAPGIVEANTQQNPFGYLEGSVLSGGTVSLIANKGFVQTDPGSLINVSGAAGTLDIPTYAGVAPMTVAGNAGAITIEGREGIVLQGALLAQAATYDGAAVAGAGGGTLTIGLGNGYSYTNTVNNNASAVQYPTPLHVLTVVGADAGANSAIPPSNQLLDGSALIDASTIEAGGFAALSLNSADTIAFAGAVALHANAGLILDAPLFSADSGAHVNLRAAYIAVGNYADNTDYYDAGVGNPNAAAVLQPASGNAVINVAAQLIDIRGISGWSGFAQENFTSTGDIRFVAPQNFILAPPSVNVAGAPNFEGAFDTSAALNLRAAQIYPTTAAAFAIDDLPPAPGSQGPSVPTVVTISSSLQAGSAAPATPFSAGGTLAIYATDIEQAGIVRAPLGQISLDAVSMLDANGNVVMPGSVILKSGSLTSVSADGLVIPYGATANGTQWIYSPETGFTQIVTQPPSKQITLNGSTVTVAGGAKLDLSGGGDLYGYEFIPGEGGSIDVLDPANLAAANHPAGTQVYTYAILPSLGSAFAPFDAQYDQGSSVAPGQTIYLSGVPGLAAGTYALLPARYALLPGAYAIQVVQQNSAIASGSAVEQSDGAYLTAARFGMAGTGVSSSLTSSVLVAPDATVRTQSQYTDSYADTFFSAAAAAGSTVAPRLPADAGQLLLSATAHLNLGGSIDFSTGSFVKGTTAAGAPITQPGLGGDVAITAQNIVIVDSVGAQNQAPAGAVQLDVQQLDNLDAQTLIIGASASTTSAGEQLSTGSTQSVELRNSIALTAPEVILAAQNSVSVDAGGKIIASGSSGAASAVSAPLLLPGGGALLRVSNGPAATLIVDPSTVPASPTGSVSIGAGADVQAAGSLLLYGTDTTTLAPGARIFAPAVGLYSSRVNVGDAPATSAGLTLTDQLLSGLKGLTDLTLGSTSTIDFYGAVQLGTASSATPGLASITLDAAGLGGYGAGGKVLQAGSISLVNSSGAAANFSTPPDGTGSLSLVAGTGPVNFGNGGKTLSGFSAVDIRAAGDIVGQGTGTLTIASTAPVPVALSGAAWIGASGSDQSLTTAGSVTFTGTAASARQPLPAAGLGVALSIQGGSIAQNGTIDLPSGDLVLSATNGITFGRGSSTSVAGAIQSYTVTQAAAPGGTIDVSSSSGSVDIGAGATVDVSGARSSTVYSGAGTLTVSAALGTFTFAGGTVEGRAAAGEGGGSFTLDTGSGLAGTGFAALNGMLTAGGFTGAIDLRTRNDSAVVIAGSVRAGSFVLSADRGRIEVAGTGVIDTSGTAGLDNDGGAIELWAGAGLEVDAGARLLANAGSAGAIGASGAALPARGGDITLGTQSGTLSIDGGGKAQPTTLSLQGGGDASTDGTFTLRAPRTAAGTGVQIAVVDPAFLEVATRNPIVVEGFKTYSASSLGDADSGCGTGGSCDIGDLNGMLFTDAQIFVANTASITASLGLQNVQVRPGIEVDSAGDLIVDNSSGVWDLASWNAALSSSEPAGAGVPGNVTLRAAGNLIFQSSLSDGFANPSTPGAPAAAPSWILGNPAGASRDSGSYLLTAGADLSAANPLAVVAQPVTASSLGAPPNSGNVVLAPNTLIRTGTGNIGIAAGGDLLLGYAVGDANGNLYDNGALQVAESDPLGAAIYTAGVPSMLGASQANLFTAPTLPRPRSGQLQAQPYYPTGGGNLTISAADDIRSAPSSQLISDWLWRRGEVSTNVPIGTVVANTDPSENTTWWVMFNEFEQGVGVLGGGNLSLSAGRDVVNVSAVVPTTGRLLVAAGDIPTAADLLLTGGGSLHVQAGGSIVGGVYEDDWGNASITAGGALTSGADSTFGQETAGENLQQISGSLPAPTTEIYPILAVGNGVFDVNARAGIALDGVTTSTTLPLIAANGTAFAGEGAAFFTYAPTNNPSTLNLVSAGGDVTLNNDVLSNLPIVALSSAGAVYEFSQNPTAYMALFPSTLNAASLSGNVNLGANTGAQTGQNGVNITLYPAAAGNLTLLASGAVENDGQPYVISMSQADPNQMPSALAPVLSTSFAGVSGVLLPQQPLHLGDAQSISIVADSGDIGAGNLVLPKAANVIAGGSITDLNYSGSNVNAADVTLIAAGGDIGFSTPTAPVTNALLSNTNGIELAGPGHLEVLAGGSINLGDANGILTTGSLTDSRLPAAGASMVIGAGLGTNASGGLRAPDYQAFIDTYLAPNAKTGATGAYAGALASYVEQIDPDASGASKPAALLAAFEALTSAQQLPLLAQVLSDELSATGLAHSLQGTGYTRGYAAINTLFPAAGANGEALSYSGNLNLFYSQIKTEQGGDIDLLVPGGSVVVGVTNPPASLNAAKATVTSTGLEVPADVNLGILVLGQGAVQGFADQDLTVNQSRILTLEGGDIILWASNGNIDAGKGAKSASGAPPPVIETDANGNLFVDPSNAVSGSGIGQLLTTPGVKAGLVNLIAPKGDVNAGDAGIRVAGNLNIAAVQVIGAGNISVGPALRAVCRPPRPARSPAHCRAPTP